MPTGNILVKVSTAKQLIPVADARFFVVSRLNGKNNILAYGTTGRNGIGQIIEVETPVKEGSLSPGGNMPFANVDIRVEHPSYYPYYISGAQIFAGIQSVQNAELIPLALPGEKRTESIAVTPQNL